MSTDDGRAVAAHIAWQLAQLREQKAELIDSLYLVRGSKAWLYLSDEARELIKLSLIRGERNP